MAGMSGWEFFSQQELDEVKDLVESTGVQKLPDYLKKKSKEWANTNIDIAVCGETYVGKSTFINQLRGVDETHKTFAPVGVGDTTLEPTPYANPFNERMIFWDLPGIGTLQFPKDERYLKFIDVDKYDFFLILSDHCFSENDAWFAREIRMRGKAFFFVRTKLDEAFQSALHDGQRLEEVVPRIYKSCTDNLRKAKFRDPQIFVISNYDHEIGQFDDLMSAIFLTLPDKKREALILSICPLTHQIIREKKQSLHKRVFGIAVLSAAAGAVPLPGLDMLVDLAVICHEVQFYMKEFGLDEGTLTHLCKKIKTPFEQVVESLKHSKSLLTEKSTIRALFMKVVKSQAVEFFGGGFAKYIPIIGSIISGSVSYGACVYFLRQEIDLLEEDAHTLIDIVVNKTRAGQNY